MIKAYSLEEAKGYGEYFYTKAGNVITFLSPKNTSNLRRINPTFARKRTNQ